MKETKVVTGLNYFLTPDKMCRVTDTHKYFAQSSDHKLS